MPVYRENVNGQETAVAQSIQRFITNGGTAVINRDRYLYICLAVASADTTLPTPAQADNGKMLFCWSEFAHAHVVTTPAGFNGKGVAGTATFGAALGNGFIAVAHNGSWWVIGNVGCVIA